MDQRRSAAYVFVLSTFATAGAQALQCQEPSSVAGIVVAEDDRLPVEGVSVGIEGTSKRTATDQRGHFHFADVPPGEITLRVEQVGYVTLTEVIDLASAEIAFLRFRLTTIAVALEELLVEGGRNPTRRDRGFAEGTVEGSEAGAFRSAADLVEQAVPGLSFTRGSGLVGGGVTMRIRGAGSLGLSDAPDVYLDGVLIGEPSHGPHSTLASLHVLQIIPGHAVERIRVLRGAAATAAFPEAKNGVILVETRT